MERGLIRMVQAINSTSVSQAYFEFPASTDRLGDVGGQKTLRSYWRNYFEKTDALIWVVDATDRLRIDDCRDELHGLLQEEVSPEPVIFPCPQQTLCHRANSSHNSDYQVPASLCLPTRRMLLDA
jgi:hypothetical protein